LELTNSLVDRIVNKPIDEPLNHYLRRYPFPFFCEPKYDGERAVLQVSDTITIANKHKTVYPERILPKNLILAIREAVHREGLYDGEFYSLRGNLYQFLSARARLSEDLALVIFDILDFKDLKLIDRKDLLTRFITPNHRVSYVSYSLCFTEPQIIGAFHRYLAEGFEGIVVKPNRDYYAKWLKLKEQHSIDVVVLGVKKTDSWKKERLPYTFLVGIYTPQGFNPIGDVSSGLDLTQRRAMATYIPELSVREDSEYIYLKPQFVLEVEYHQKTPNGLREPKIKRIRFDKSVTECREETF